MNRFQKRTGRLRTLRPFVSVILFCLMLLASISRTTAQEEADRLKDAVLQGAVQCYALEGFYPEDLTYLKEHYGLTYDSEKYVVSYEIIGSNLMPDVSVISLDKGGNGS